MLLYRDLGEEVNDVSYHNDALIQQEPEFCIFLTVLII